MTSDPVKVGQQIVKDWGKEDFEYNPIDIDWSKIDRYGRWKDVNGTKLDALEAQMKEMLKELRELRQGTRLPPVNVPDITF